MKKTINYDCSAPVFNIQSYSIHDGPGIRTTVFVKGCPLRCLWCANPESNLAKPQLMTYTNKCTGCGECVEKCPMGAITVKAEGEKVAAYTDRMKCNDCGACIAACPNEAREIAGKMMTVREAFDRIKQDKLFLVSSGGGMTVSGGEALAHPEFTANLLAAAHEDGLHTAIESCVFAPREVVESVFTYVDLALLDIKHMDSAAHKRLTGVPNEMIFENIRYIHNVMHVPVILRVPVIPGYNDDEENILAVGQFAASLGSEVPVNLLPYHRLGDSKSESLGIPRNLDIEVPDSMRMQKLKELVESCGVKAQIGG